MNLMYPLLKRNHILCTDSFYSSIELFEKMLSESTEAIEMINKFRKRLPKKFTKAENEETIECASNGRVMLTK